MDIVIYVVLFVVTAVYALWLNTAAGKRFVDDFTWASVVTGNVLILAALWFLIPADAWQKVVIAFVVAGLPMIGRSLLNRSGKRG